MVTRLPDIFMLHLYITLCHHPVQKRSVIDSLIHRATTICQPDKLQKELEHLQTSLHSLGHRQSAQNTQKAKS